jgi:hypothetical protein
MAGKVKDYKMINVQLGDLSNAQSNGSADHLLSSALAAVPKQASGRLELRVEPWHRTSPPLN